MTRRVGICVFLLALTAAACGKKGPPLIPLPNVPQAVSELTVRRLGDEIYLKFKIPVANSTGEKPANIRSVVVYAFTGRPTSNDDFVKYGTVVAEVPVRKPPPPPPPVKEGETPPPPLPVPTGPGMNQGDYAVVLDKLTPEALVPVVTKEEEERLKKLKPVPIVTDLPLLGPASVIPVRTYVVVGVNHRGRRGNFSSRVPVPLLTAPAAPSKPTVTYTARAFTVGWTRPESARISAQQTGTTATADDEDTDKPGTDPATGAPQSAPAAGDVTTKPDATTGAPNEQSAKPAGQGAPDATAPAQSPTPGTPPAPTRTPGSQPASATAAGMAAPSPPASTPAATTPTPAVSTTQSSTTVGAPPTASKPPTVPPPTAPAPAGSTPGGPTPTPPASTAPTQTTQATAGRPGAGAAPSGSPPAPQQTQPAGAKRDQTPTPPDTPAAAGQTPPGTPAPTPGGPPPGTPGAPGPLGQVPPPVPTGPPPILASRPLFPVFAPSGFNVYEIVKVEPPAPGVVSQTAAPPPAAGASAELEMLQNPVPLNLQPILIESFQDARLEFGTERCYAVRMVNAFGTLRLESPASETTCVSPFDSFPPAAPKGLAAVGSESAIDLIWEPSNEADLAGYLVLRGAPGDETLQRLTPSPIRQTTYRDSSVKRGVRYAYVVVAVDKAEPPNISAPSARVEETAR